MCMMRFGDALPGRFILVVDFRSSPGTDSIRQIYQPNCFPTASVLLRKEDEARTEFSQGEENLLDSSRIFKHSGFRLYIV